MQKLEYLSFSKCLGRTSWALILLTGYRQEQVKSYSGVAKIAGCMTCRLASPRCLDRVVYHAAATVSLCGFMLLPDQACNCLHGLAAGHCCKREKLVSRKHTCSMLTNVQILRGRIALTMSWHVEG